MEWSFQLDNSWVSVKDGSNGIRLRIFDDFGDHSPTKEFRMQKGLRQSNPLAPFLFFIVAEILKILVTEAKEKGVFDGIKVGYEEVGVSHLQYAVDARESGLLSFLYLGLPVGASMRKLDSWKATIEKWRNTVKAKGGHGPCVGFLWVPSGQSDTRNIMDLETLLVLTGVTLKCLATLDVNDKELISSFGHDHALHQYIQSVKMGPEISLFREEVQIPSCISAFNTMASAESSYALYSHPVTA
ncbi:LOW QUALITY PROTEIN: hypothetical protein OSB04_007333 [Centaurea solstitialis]|uniref:Uncharacterized protein n=1 Tax=Centaurea solstitialis TaxID=347529 RepID=A0AA38TSA3_9ASTR|nr:LOW QUALITY PROTEIN: hypothetical protein OSB04_007333 [Centaurea solstitialis]